MSKRVAVRQTLQGLGLISASVFCFTKCHILGSTAQASQLRSSEALTIVSVLLFAWGVRKLIQGQRRFYSKPRRPIMVTTRRYTVGSPENGNPDSAWANIVKAMVPDYGFKTH